MDNELSWDKKDEWHSRGNDFLIVVKHYIEPVPEHHFDDGTHRWNVYAYIYPRHERFTAFSGPEMFQDAASAMPLHGGPSFLRWHYDDDGDPTSVQVGSDYNHLHDEHFSHYATQEDAYEVFSDAAALYAYLSNKPQVFSDAAALYAYLSNKPQQE